MVHGLRITILGLCVAVILTLTAGAQQAPANGNPNKKQIQQLMKDMQAIRHQVEPLRAKMSQLESQIKVLRYQMLPFEEKMSADREKMKALLGENSLSSNKQTN